MREPSRPKKELENDLKAAGASATKTEQLTGMELTGIPKTQPIVYTSNY